MLKAIFGFELRQQFGIPCSGSWHWFSRCSASVPAVGCSAGGRQHRQLLRNAPPVIIGLLNSFA